MLWIVSSPAYAKIIKPRPGTQTQLRPLETLTKCYEIVFKKLISNIEQITLFAASPWWIRPLITIHHGKKETEKVSKHLVNEMTRKKHCLLVYTDGSSINEKIGAAAVGPTTIWNIFLGSTSLFTLYSGELCGIFLAKEITLEAYIEPSVVIICVDN